MMSSNGSPVLGQGLKESARPISRMAHISWHSAYKHNCSCSRLIGHCMGTANQEASRDHPTKFNNSNASYDGEVQWSNCASWLNCASDNIQQRKHKRSSLKDSEGFERILKGSKDSKGF